MQIFVLHAYLLHIHVVWRDISAQELIHYQLEIDGFMLYIELEIM